MQATVKVTSVGQISIPYEIRAAMNIEAGDLVTIDVMSVVKKSQLNKGI